MIKAVIFDVGGVLIRTHDHQPRRRWEAELGLREWQSEELVFSGDIGTAAQMGTLTDEQLWSEIGRRLELNPERLARFRAAFWSGDVLDADLIDFIRQLNAHYQTAIVSNATDALRRLLQEKHDIADAFDLIVCSAEEGIMKPDPDIYRLTLKRLGRKPQEAVFVDDSPENVSAARQLGMHAIHYQEGLDVKSALAQVGVGVPDSETIDREQREVNGD